ncbi:MAG: gamma-glutamyl-gamma-aminobutyrate hydrolase family protein, partial [Candidatus Eremiobacterota bacterium]
WSAPSAGNASTHRTVPDLVRAVRRAGGAPELVYQGAPLDPSYRALLLPGGGDLHPGFYGQSVASGVDPSGLDPAFDRFQLEWTGRALRDGTPVLGICRGMQVLNVAAGGTLHQDLGEAHAPARVLHDPTLRGEAVHTLAVAPGSEIGRLVGKARVNSIHHQSLDRVGPGLRVTARAEDGTAEAIEGTAHGWQLGVQFHPEDMLDRPAFQRIFDRLVEVAANFQGAVPH